MGLTPDSPLSAFAVAEAFDIDTWSADDVDGLSKSDRQQLCMTDGDSWSAFTLRINDRHLIVFNPAQSQARVNSVVMHEVSHITLGHELASAGLTADGHLIPSNYNQDQEDEADWLGGTLLLPRPALLSIRRKGMSDEEAMQRFLVSRQMLQWRFRMTGVDYQLANTRHRRR